MSEKNKENSKNQKSPASNAKLYIGLTTKPLVLSYLNNTTILNILRGQKSLSFMKGFLFTGGLDGTRTRDPMRDRHVF